MSKRRGPSDGTRLGAALAADHKRLSGGSDLDTESFPEMYKRVEVHSLVSSAAVQLTPVLLSYLPNFRPGAVVIPFPRDTSYHHALQIRSHLPRRRDSLRQRLDRPGRPLPRS